MSEQDQSSKTEDASEQKIRKAKAEGNTWTSREGGHLMAYGGLLVIVLLILPAFGPQAVLDMARILDLAGTIDADSPDAVAAVSAVMIRAAATLLIPALTVMMLGAALSALAGGPLVATLKRLEPKGSKINPASGFKRLVSAQNLVEFIKSLLKLCLIAGLFLKVLYDAMDQLLPGALLLPESLAPFIGQAAGYGLMQVCAVMLPFVIFDIFWKRRQWLKKLMMSKQDQKDEAKDSEGDPHIRARRQELRRKAQKRPFTKSVPEATLVITNPTHYAVALRYERGIDAAPVCIARGQDRLALRIRQIALDAGVPVLESPPLARALHACTEEDAPIPEQHWQAVAGLVGYVLDLRKRIRRKLPEGTRHFDG